MEETIQVKMSYLNKLLDQTGEVIIAGTRHNILEKAIEDIFIHQKPPDESIVNLAKQISHSSRQTVDHLHENVMKIRQVELKDTLTTLQRLVRELSKSQGKRIKFTAAGHETLVDKTIVEELSGALIHVIRNAVDHGIETPAKREADDKNAEGAISINAYINDGFTFIEIEDDGGGLDIEKICARALERGLTTCEKLEKMSVEEKYSFVFLPGFSTRETVSEISGRGVGMDVVKTSVDKLNGSIGINSKRGDGTKFLFKIPVISAVNITDALMAEIDGAVYAFPLDTVVSVSAVTPENLFRVSGNRAIVFRQETLIIYDLGLLWKKRINEKTDESLKCIVVIKDREDMIGICVDDFLPPQKIVIKTLDNRFGGARGIAGTTFLDGNNIALIIDAHEIIGLATGREPAVPVQTQEAPDRAAPLFEPEAVAAAAKSAANIASKKYKVEIDSDINRDTMLEIALCSQGKLIDAFNNNKPVYEIGLMLDKDIIKSQKSRFDIYQNVKSCGELIFIIPMTAAVPKNLRDFSPETFDMCVKFFLISNMTQAEIAKKLNIDDTQIHAVGITVKEEPGPAPVETPVFEEIELLEDYETFAMDTQKNISAMSHSIMTLEENRSDTEAINEIFRAVHTLKSATAMLGIKNMSDVAHILESMLDRVRNGLEIIDEERIDLLFEVLKFFEECLKSIKNGIKPTLSNSAVKERINKLKYDAPEKKLIRTVDVKTEKFHVTSYENLVIKEKIAGGMKPYTILVEFVADLPMKMVNAFLLFKNLKDYGEVVKTIPTMEEIDNGNFEMHFKILYLASYMEDEFRKALASEEIKNYVVSVYDEI